MRLLDGASIPVPKVSLVIIIHRVCLTAFVGALGNVGHHSAQVVGKSPSQRKLVYH
jgi:hypothetical protein